MSDPAHEATAEPPASPPAADGALQHHALAEAVGLRDRVVEEVGRVYLGGESVVHLCLAALLARGHVLLEGVPGLAKTTLAKAMARTLGCDHRRVQFTPDLLPADITGTWIYNQKTMAFDLRRGPLFAQIVLADEINRAPAKTQSALLEAMQERQVTIEGHTEALPDPFLVLATQNPVEQEGVYSLPEAQLDRFLVRIRLDYPQTGDEVAMLQTWHRPAPEVRDVCTVEELLRIAAMAVEVHVEERVLGYVVRLAQATRAHGRVALGVSPRGSLALVRLAKVQALLSGRAYVTPDDVRQLAPFVLEHRMLVTTDAAIEGTTPGDVLAEVLERTPVLGADEPPRLTSLVPASHRGLEA